MLAPHRSLFGTPAARCIIENRKAYFLSSHGTTDVAPQSSRTERYGSWPKPSPTAAVLVRKHSEREPNRCSPPFCCSLRSNLLVHTAGLFLLEVRAFPARTCGTASCDADRFPAPFVFACEDSGGAVLARGSRARSFISNRANACSRPIFPPTFCASRLLPARGASAFGCESLLALPDKDPAVWCLGVVGEYLLFDPCWGGFLDVGVPAWDGCFEIGDASGERPFVGARLRELPCGVALAGGSKDCTVACATALRRFFRTPSPLESAFLAVRLPASSLARLGKTRLRQTAREASMGMCLLWQASMSSRRAATTRLSILRPYPPMQHVAA